VDYVKEYCNKSVNVKLYGSAKFRDLDRPSAVLRAVKSEDLGGLEK
jgi:hypothetical protein